MNIVIDAFGGDNAPLEVIKGSIDAQKDFGVDVTLVGDEEKIKKCTQENGLDTTALHIKHADTVIEICEEPTEVIKGKKDCSMAVGMKMLADGEGDAFEMLDGTHLPVRLKDKNTLFAQFTQYQFRHMRREL